MLVLVLHENKYTLDRVLHNSLPSPVLGSAAVAIFTSHSGCSFADTEADLLSPSMMSTLDYGWHDFQVCFSGCRVQPSLGNAGILFLMVSLLPHLV